MVRTVMRRVAEVLVVLLLVTFVTSMLLEIVPGDPAVAILGPEQPPEAYAQLRDQLGLNEPVLTRYVSWLKAAITGDFGESVVAPAGSVMSRVGAALPVSLELVGLGLLISLTVSVSLALASAARPGGRVDRLVSATCYGLVSLPSFLVGMLLILLLVKLWPVFPRAEWVRIESLGDIGPNLRHALLPALVVAIPEIPVFTRVLRGDLVETMGQDFILSARARGLPQWRVLLGEALRPSSYSLVTLAAVSLGRLVGSTVVAEYLFGLPGIGSLIVGSATTKDIALLQGAVVVIALLYVSLNALVDLSYAWLDPRVRRRGA